ncbi:helix-turn-helix domain-containing protein [Jatrophihabitans telluris]|uniref:Helix-turn-helix domain-containing protein n=1 Tax=Jatrophihabitans telluris TaxID=2038343 RepID=A0ABY4R262_9ACTN|nr:helix-turn-helix domain-containing protein [Jatrophihabitans telluris]UQX89627.1 helix-turn-helix domain-containing protein [Jatrophihabitans telluris]
MALNKVVTLIFDGIHPFEFGVACEAFGIDRSDQGLPVYDFVVASEAAGPVQTYNRFSMSTDDRFSEALDADLVIVSAGETAKAPPAVVATLRQAYDNGARVMALCSGAFVLGEAGLLDGRDCTTHWRHAAELARRYPQARVDPNVLYVCDGRVYTSAGTAAGLDLCLHLMRTVHGADVANAVARRMVVPPHRDGGQAQYINQPVSPTGTDGLSELMDELLTELDEIHTVNSMAARVNMSSRTFARKFNEATGTTPHSWLLRQRVLYARQQLESTQEPIERIAQTSGFGTAALLRHHFQRHTGVAPTAYRRAFSAIHHR